MQTTSHQKVLKLVQLAILAAMIVVLQLFGSGIRIGTIPISLVLIPIVLGAVLLGPNSGAALGLVFGAVTLIAGITGMDFFTHFLFQANPVVTSLLCLLKAGLAGFGAGWIYRLLEYKNRWLAVILASAAAPVINTGIFVLGTLTILNPTIADYIAQVGPANGFGDASVIYFVIILCAGVNFIAELAVNLIASPVIARVYTALTHRK